MKKKRDPEDDPVRDLALMMCFMMIKHGIISREMTDKPYSEMAKTMRGKFLDAAEDMVGVFEAVRKQK